MNIVLIGYRGAGKSAVAAFVANELGIEAVCMDETIVRRSGMPIPELVEKKGWPYFRDMESELARDLGRRDGLVIDTGGGIVERPENIEHLKANGFVVWLDASVETVVLRIRDGIERPALTAGKSFTEEVAEVLARRKSLYEAAADVRIPTPTGDGTVAAVARAVIATLGAAK